ncbi:hypothetical protein IFR09_00940 [Pseudomonas syringae]|uniref:hypothetical protein n=1 Tax=Pseudomonas sp. Leaf127 TaxID=1736267 RepID=UPI00070311FC|nr:hypothetical protein [Pseudomonas sp. Leaf127]MBD8572887.1 hypothetical protein [Pseudomonas syringae]KQQ55597.1 hypothetical protein ASF84_09655 [Pseudomonas sp. Leaf127]MBD8790661.1 hypothetical protein [Pseudomonas syringae]MBD8798899.1 hypothetical protein [Pseudomonas syringae]MBD8809726.1 hypothetical protein [Pseudomonas syringae]
MAQRLFTRAVLALLLPSCAGVAAFSTPTAADPSRPAMPAQACEKTADGFGTFFETFVTDPALREAYSAPTVHRPAEPFRVALVDSRWVFDEPEKDASDLVRIKLDLVADGERMRADFIKAEFSADDEVIRTLGAPQAYLFEYRQHCWQLVQHLR